MKTNVIDLDQDILCGTPVFSGTRVPLKNLFDHLESGENITSFLEDFEGVSKDQVLKVLEMSKSLLESSSTIIGEILLMSVLLSTSKNTCQTLK